MSRFLCSEAMKSTRGRLNVPLPKNLLSPADEEQRQQKAARLPRGTKLLPLPS